MSRPASPSFLPFANRIAKGTSLNDKLRVAFAAGYVEGAMTSSRTWQHWQNFLKRPVWKQRIPFSRWKLPSASLGLSKTLHILSVSVSDALLLIQVETRSLDYCSKSQHRFALWQRHQSWIFESERLPGRQWQLRQRGIEQIVLRRILDRDGHHLGATWWAGCRKCSNMWNKMPGFERVPIPAGRTGPKALCFHVFPCVSMCFMCFPYHNLGLLNPKLS